MLLYLEEPRLCLSPPPNGPGNTVPSMRRNVWSSNPNSWRSQVAGVSSGVAIRGQTNETSNENDPKPDRCLDSASSSASFGGPAAPCPCCTGRRRMDRRRPRPGSVSSKADKCLASVSASDEHHDMPRLVQPTTFPAHALSHHATHVGGEESLFARCLHAVLDDRLRRRVIDRGEKMTVPLYTTWHLHRAAPPASPRVIPQSTVYGISAWLMPWLIAPLAIIQIKVPTSLDSWARDVRNLGPGLLSCHML